MPPNHLGLLHFGENWASCLFMLANEREQLPIPRYDSVATSLNSSIPELPGALIGSLIIRNSTGCESWGTPLSTEQQWHAHPLELSNVQILAFDPHSPYRRLWWIHGILQFSSILPS
jgi:hypothetical protein